MTEPKHTPGPWKVGPVDDSIVTAADGSEVAQIDGDYNQPDLWPIMEANARLIAAAPDMYKALRNAVRFLDYFANNRHTFVGPGTPLQALAEARDALGMADGK